MEMWYTGQKLAQRTMSWDKILLRKEITLDCNSNLQK